MNACFLREAVVSAFIPHTDVSDEMALSINKESSPSLKPDEAPSFVESGKHSLGRKIKSASFVKVPKVRKQQFSFDLLVKYIFQLSSYF